MNLQLLKNFVEELNSSNSSNEKLEVLRSGKYEELKPLIKLIYSPFDKFNVTSNNLKKRSDLIDYNAQGRDLINILTELSERKVTGHEAIALVNGFIEGNKEFKELLYKVIDKSLEVRLEAKSINKVWQELIPEFSVALANNYEDHKHKLNIEEFYASRKLDGVRCIAYKKGEEVTLYSRSGKEFETLDKIKESIKEYFDFDVVLDGEICLVDEEGNENFQGIMKEIRRKNHIIQNPKYMIFDILKLEDFDKGTSSQKFSERILKLNRFAFDNKFLEAVRQTKIESETHLLQLSEEAEQEGWEGLILRRDSGYKGKRSNELLKVKKFHDAEYVVEEVEMGNIRYIKEGLDCQEEMLSRVTIIHKDNKVGVGSGFSMDQRREFFKNPEKILGKTIKVKYFEETTDQYGNKSLRFPTVCFIYEEARSD